MMFSSFCIVLKFAHMVVVVEFEVQICHLDGTLPFGGIITLGVVR